ncbi:hypothetical protein [Pseudomonas sp. 1928-m]|uniref:hypothetical protein n=1 Tax=Pseudomonas sp. 1928-m TaxID=3033804 RepID=UPI0023E0421C|nr:hypothetical protein [Pseudomonas sp. 1928-m]MDF3196597.1 hypothetical protein [Pseudomonas sp. 1928-m]
MEFIKEYWFNTLIIAYMLYMGFIVIKRGGIKNAALGSKVIRTHGAILGEKNFGLSKTMKIHTVTESGSEKICLEISNKSILGWSMQPFTMSKHEAQNLINHLEKAIGGKSL